MNKGTSITARRHCKCGDLEDRHDPVTKLCLRPGCNLCKPYGSNGNKGFEFSGYEAQEPTVEVRERYGSEETIERHPSFAQIGASRVSGGAFLYGSDFRHQHYITIQIHESELHRSLSGDSAFAGRRIIEVALSEAQWATFVSSLNQGGGVQCTVDYSMQDGPIPAIAAPKDRRTQFSKEMKERFGIAQSALAEAEAEINALPLSGVKKKALKDKLQAVRMNIGQNTNFVADRFDEHMEKTVEKAKVEVNAYAENLRNRLANQAVLEGGMSMNPLLLEAPIEHAFEHDEDSVCYKCDEGQL